MSRSKTNTVLDILYAKEYKTISDVYAHVFEIHKEIPENPEFLRLVRSMAEEKGILFEYDGKFYGKSVLQWIWKYPSEDVIQAIKNVVPKEYCSDVLYWIRYTYKTEPELIIFLLLNEIESSKETIKIHQHHLNKVSIPQAQRLKELMVSRNKKIHISFEVNQAVLFQNALDVFENHPCFTVFKEETLGCITLKEKQKLKDFIANRIKYYTEYRLKNKTVPPYVEEEIYMLLPHYLFFTDLFLEELFVSENNKDIGMVILKHIEQYKVGMKFSK